MQSNKIINAPPLSSLAAAVAKRKPANQPSKAQNKLKYSSFTKPKIIPSKSEQNRNGESYHNTNTYQTDVVQSEGEKKAPMTSLAAAVARNKLGAQSSKKGKEKKQSYVKTSQTEFSKSTQNYTNSKKYHTTTSYQTDTIPSEDGKKAPMTSLAAAVAKNRLGSQSSKVGNELRQGSSLQASQGAFSKSTQKRNNKTYYNKSNTQTNNSKPSFSSQPSKGRGRGRGNPGGRGSSGGRGTSGGRGSSGGRGTSGGRGSSGGRGKGKGRGRGSSEGRDSSGGRGKGKGRKGNNYGRGSQGRGHYKQEKNDSYATKRMNKEVTKESKTKNYGNSKNDNNSFGSKDLKGSSSRRLDDNATRQNKQSNPTPMDKKRYSTKRGQNPENTDESGFDTRYKNKSTLQQNQTINHVQNDDTPRGPLLISSTDKIDSTFKKPPMKRWIDEDDDADY